MTATTAPVSPHSFLPVTLRHYRHLAPKQSGHPEPKRPVADACPTGNLASLAQRLSPGSFIQAAKTPTLMEFHVVLQLPRLWVELTAIAALTFINVQTVTGR